MQVQCITSVVPRGLEMKAAKIFSMVLIAVAIAATTVATTSGALLQEATAQQVPQQSPPSMIPVTTDDDDFDDGRGDDDADDGQAGDSTVTQGTLRNDDDDDRHSFTIDAPYNIDADLADGENTVITLTADTEGIFQYYSKHDQPQMIGQLVVLPENQQLATASNSTIQ